MVVMSPLLRRLLARQAGVVARRQLLPHGIDSDDVRNQVRARRWTLVTPRVVSTTTGRLDREQREWVAVLHAGPRSVLGGLTSAEHLGLDGWHRDIITVWVDDELSFEPVDGVRFFRTRRPFDLLRHPGGALPVARIEPSVLLHAGYVASPREAHGLLAATVQQGLSTPTRLVGWIDQLRPLRRAKEFRATLSDIDGGSHSAAELDVLRLCRRAGIPLPERQVSRTDAAGRARWTDCEWRLGDGRTLVLEVDGGHHMEARQWAEDKRRHRRLVGPGRLVVSCTTYELRHEREALVTDLLALGLSQSCA